MNVDSGGMRTGKREERVQEVEEGYILGRRCRELPKNMPTSFRLAEVALFCASSTPMYYLLPENTTFIHRDNNSSSPGTPSATIYMIYRGALECHQRKRRWQPLWHLPGTVCKDYYHYIPLLLPPPPPRVIKGYCIDCSLVISSHYFILI